MWKRVALPTMIVALLWLAAGTATTIYLLWLDRSYQRVFRENVAPREALADLIEDLWRAEARAVAQRESLAPPPLSAERPAGLQDDLEHIRPWMLTAPEQATFTELARLVQDYEQAFQGQDAMDPVVQATRRKTLAEAIDQRARVIRQINQRLIDDSAQHRQRTTTIVFWLRVAILMIGPAGGMMLGWNMARRLRSSVKRIQVTLRHEDSHEPLELGTIAVAPDDDLEEIGEQVAELVRRLEATTQELREARAEVVRAERLAAIGELAAGVAHEFRNPLTSVKLLLQHAAQRDSSSLTTPKLRLILDEIERMEETIQGLLDFSRPAVPQRLRHDLREPLRRAANLVEGRATRQGVRVVLDLGTKPRLCDGDARQLQQVFSNLLINGIEAMPDGGTLVVRLTDDPDRSYWRIEFTDEGAGIPPDVLPRLFEPFVSLKERGTGLGLAVSRRIIEAHGGELTASNRADGGASVNVCLPLVPSPPFDLSDAGRDDASQAPRASTLCGPR